MGRMGRSSSPGGVKNFHFSMSSRPALGSTQPPIQWLPGALSPGVKRPGGEADHSLPASTEVKKMWIYTFTPLYVIPPFFILIFPPKICEEESDACLTALQALFLIFVLEISCVFCKAETEFLNIIHMNFGFHMSNISVVYYTTLGCTHNTYCVRLYTM
jgi:hypothetical protein